MRDFALAILASGAVALLASCSGDPGAPEGTSGGSDTKLVIAVNYPLAYFAERIAGGAARVELPAPPGVDPAYWRPSGEEVGRIQGADLVLRNGAGYAKWVERVSLAPSRVVDTSEAFEDRYLELGEVVHSHGPEGEHSHAAVDFNTWLDPNFAVSQAQAVFDALLGLAPSGAGAMRDAYDELARDLRDLDARLKKLSAKLGDAPLIASHPVYGYLASRYDWKLESLHWEPDAMPSDEQWAELDELLERHPAKVLIWEAEPDAALAAKVEERGLANVVFEPCGNRPDEGDYLSVMRGNIEALQGAL